MNRKLAREHAFLLLFEGFSRADATPEEIFELATTERQLETDDFVRNVFFGVYEHLEAIDGVITDKLRGWKKERVSSVSMALLRLAVYELLYREDIPKKVSINEAIELSKKYDEEKSYIFVNGVLNAVSTDCNKA